MRRQILAGIIALSVLLLLVGGLNSIELQSNRLAPRIDLGKSAFEFPPLSSFSPEFQGFLQFVLRVFLITMLPISIIYLIYSPPGRKRILISLLFLTVNTYVLLVLLRGLGISQLNVDPLDSSGLPAFETGEFVELEPIDPPAWLAPAIAFSLAAGVAATVIAVSKRRRRGETIAIVAERAISDLQAGRDFDDTIMECYFRMCDYLAQSRGIQRGRAMTPREFELFLLDEGYPPEGVSTLTRLFERVRYGDVRLGPDGQHEARLSLKIIAGAALEA
jgi:hypothetical protein